jgi:general secretion pathway protein A
MYTAHYKLKIKPFQISSDAAFIWLGEKHKEALATLRYGILDNKGFLLLTGNVGTGKTTLINALIGSLNNDVIYASVPDPSLDKSDFFNYIAAAFGINGEFTSKGKFLASFAKFLHKAYENNKKVLLIIDESQLMTQELLEEIRLLSNIVTKDSSPLLNIFFVGQYEFNEIIRRPENRAVAQRLTLNYYIEPLTVEETGEYIQHRLKIAGSTEKIFHPSAVKAIYDFSEGFPRKINIICDHCLMSGYAEDKRIITSSIVRDSAKELQIPRHKRGERPERPLPVEQPHRSMPASPLQHPDSLEQPHEQSRQETVDVSRPPKAKKKSFFQLMTGVLLILLVFLSFGFFYLYFTGTTYKEVFTSLRSIQEHILLRIPQLTGEKQRPELSGKTVLLENKQEAALLPAQDIMPVAPVTGPLEKNEQTPSVPLPRLEETDALKEISRAGAENNGAFFPETIKMPAAIAEETPAPSVNVESLSEEAETTAASGRDSDKTMLASARENPVEPPPPLPEEPLVIRFKSDSNEFSRADIEKMKVFSGLVRLNPGTIINVFGYTDAIGDPGYNIKLSQFRANIVKSFLLGQNIPPEQIKAQGLGDRNPIATNGTAAGRIMNRRVEISVDGNK